MQPIIWHLCKKNYIKNKISSKFRTIQSLSFSDYVASMYYVARHIHKIYNLFTTSWNQIVQRTQICKPSAAQRECLIRYNYTYYVLQLLQKINLDTNNFLRPNVQKVTYPWDEKSSLKTRIQRGRLFHHLLQKLFCHLFHR